MNKILLSIFVSLLTFSVASAAEKTESSTLVAETVKKVQKTVVDKINVTTPDELDDLLREIIAPVFDFEEMSKRCLGVNWRTATPKQQAEFQDLFSNLLAKNYLKQIREKAQGAQFKLYSANERKKKATVQTIVTTDNGTLKIDYRLYNNAGNWKVYDVIVENIGLVSNYRSEFSDIIGREGMEGLLVRLRAK